MTDQLERVRAPAAEALNYPIGLTFDVAFDAFTVQLTTLPDHELRFHIAEGPFARTEIVAIDVTTICPGVFAISWVEASGATVVHVEDFAKGLVYSRATLPDGTFLRMQGPIRIVSQDSSQ